VREGYDELYPKLRTMIKERCGKYETFDQIQICMEYEFEDAEKLEILTPLYKFLLDDAVHHWRKENDTCMQNFVSKTDEDEKGSFCYMPYDKTPETLFRMRAVIEEGDTGYCAFTHKLAMVGMILTQTGEGGTTFWKFRDYTFYQSFLAAVRANNFESEVPIFLLLGMAHNAVIDYLKNGGFTNFKHFGQSRAKAVGLTFLSKVQKQE